MDFRRMLEKWESGEVQRSELRVGANLAHLAACNEDVARVARLVIEACEATKGHAVAPTCPGGMPWLAFEYGRAEPGTARHEAVCAWRAFSKVYDRRRWGVPNKGALPDAERHAVAAMAVARELRAEGV